MKDVKNRPYGCLRGDFQAEGTGSVKVLRNSKEQCVGVEWLGEVTGDSVGVEWLGKVTRDSVGVEWLGEVTGDKFKEVRQSGARVPIFMP